MSKKINLSFYKSILYSDFAYDNNNKKLLDVLMLHKEMKQFLRITSFIKKETGNLVLAVDKQIDYFLLKNSFELMKSSSTISIKVVKNPVTSLIQNKFTTFLFLKRYLSSSHFSSMLFNKVYLYIFFYNLQDVDYLQGFYKIQNDMGHIKKKLFLIGFLEKICATNIRK
jgi:hypothetical protein